VILYKNFTFEEAHGGAVFRCLLCEELVSSYFPAVVRDIPEHIERQLDMHMHVKHETERQGIEAQA